jgi:hypothetical protein
MLKITQCFECELILVAAAFRLRAWHRYQLNTQVEPAPTVCYFVKESARIQIFIIQSSNQAARW